MRGKASPKRNPDAKQRRDKNAATLEKPTK